MLIIYMEIFIVRYLLTKYLLGLIIIITNIYYNEVFIRNIY